MFVLKMLYFTFDGLTLLFRLNIPNITEKKIAANR